MAYIVHIGPKSIIGTILLLPLLIFLMVIILPLIAVILVIVAILGLITFIFTKFRNVKKPEPKTKVVDVEYRIK